MEKIKNYLILGLFISSVLFGFLWYCSAQTPKVVKETITKEKIKKEIQYVKANAVITGGTNATIKPDGSVAVSGNNISIVNKVETRIETQIVEKEKEVIKYKSGTIIANADWSADSLIPEYATVKYKILDPVYLGPSYIRSINKVLVGIAVIF